MSVPYPELTLEDFVTRLGSDTPTPGGGSVAALTLALSAALGRMVVMLSVGRPRFAEHEAGLLERRERLREAAQDALAAIAADEAAFVPLTRAWKLPADSPERAAAVEAGLVSAAGAPLALLASCRKLLDELDWLPGRTSRLAVSDIACAAELAGAAAAMARVNVLVNTRLMTDRETAERMNREAEAALAACRESAGSLSSGIAAELARPRG
ncbi:MAG: cyclodeaminase/cyclohydrolase family protein [Bacillota bacterium]|nr:cyclodeaminase/cyclohydrolase family protein [Bacillota bacterium]